MKHIIVGASGLIGNALYAEISKNGEKIIGTYAKNFEANLIKFDLTQGDFKSLLDIVNSDDIVYILSAYSNPSWIYKNKAVAEELNWTATSALIDALKIKHPRIIFMSSVEVFDGVKGGYFENDTSNPLNYYGQLKYRVEKHLKDTYLNHTIVRTGWNVGLDKKSRCVVKLTYESLLNPGAKMASDNQFSISSVADTARALYALSKFPEIKKIHICSDGVVSRTLLASMICRHSIYGNKMSYSECLFNEIPYTEPRGRVNDLNNALSKRILGITYKNVEQIILDKIRFIDANES